MRRVTGIVFKDITMENVSNPIFIDGTYCPEGQKPYPCPPGRVAVTIDNIMFDNITGTGRWDTVVNFDCSAVSPCRNITLQRVHLTPIAGGQGIIKCNNADNMTWVDTPHSAQCSTYLDGSLTRHGLAGGRGFNSTRDEVESRSSALVTDYHSDISLKSDDYTNAGDVAEPEATAALGEAGKELAYSTLLANHNIGGRQPRSPPSTWACELKTDASTIPQRVASPADISFTVLENWLIICNGQHNFSVSMRSPEFSITVGLIGTPNGTIKLAPVSYDRRSMIFGDIGHPAFPWSMEIAYPPAFLRHATLSISVRLVWSPEEQTLRKTAGYNISQPQPLLTVAEIILERVPAIPTGWLQLDANHGNLESYPGLFSGFFAAIEFPYASSRINGSEFVLAHQPGVRFNGPGAPQYSRTSVVGVVATRHTTLQSFDIFVAANRVGQPGRHVNYNVWWTLPFPYSLSDVLGLTLRQKLFTPFAANFDSLAGRASTSVRGWTRLRLAIRA